MPHSLERPNQRTSTIRCCQRPRATADGKSQGHSHCGIQLGVFLKMISDVFLLHDTMITCRDVPPDVLETYIHMRSALTAALSIISNNGKHQDVFQQVN